jgi:signal transduction histidine kinase
MPKAPAGATYGKKSRTFRHDGKLEALGHGIVVDEVQLVWKGVREMSMEAIKTLLIIEDNPGDVRLLREMLMENGACQAELFIAQTMRDAVGCLGKHLVDIILLDLGLPDAEGLAAIRRTLVAAPGIPLVVLTGMDDEVLAAQSLQEGAQDYLIKGQIEPRALLRALRYATERKRLERLKDEFVSTVSHELRTPLTSIAGSLGLLMARAGDEMSEPVARLLRIAHSNCERLVRLVNDILDIEKLEAGRVSFDMKKVDVGSLVQQAVDAIKGFAGALGVSVRVETSGDAVAYVRADSDRFVQVMTNLLSNAVKFTVPQSEVVAVIEKQEDTVRISVRDHGAGIPANFRSLIFERFAQADASNARQKGGTGLGLSIVKQVVGRLGGEVGFSDATGGGTIFYVELPCWGGKADLLREKHSKSESSDDGSSQETLLEEAGDRISLAPVQSAEEAV